jgi:hypothetical protein
MARDIEEKGTTASVIENEHLKPNALAEAHAASDAEHATTVSQAFRENWRAAMWSAVISLTLVMEGYDLALMSNFFGYPTFQHKFGSYVGARSAPLTPTQCQTLQSNLAPCQALSSVNKANTRLLVSRTRHLAADGGVAGRAAEWPVRHGDHRRLHQRVVLGAVRLPTHRASGARVDDRRHFHLLLRGQHPDAPRRSDALRSLLGRLCNHR